MLSEAVIHATRYLASSMPPSSSTSQAPPFLPPSSDWRGVNLVSMGEDLPIGDDGEERQQLLPSSSEAGQLEQPPSSSFLVAAARQDPLPFSFNLRSTSVAAEVDLRLKEMIFPISLPVFTVRTPTRKYGLGALGWLDDQTSRLSKLGSNGPKPQSTLRGVSCTGSQVRWCVK